MEIKRSQQNSNIKIDEEKMSIEGYAIIFDDVVEHKITDGFLKESISADCLENCDISNVVLRYNHYDNFPVLARTSNGSLVLEQDEKGLKIKADLIDTSVNRDMYNSVKNKLIDKMSFCATVASETESYDDSNSTLTVEIKKLERLIDVAIVDFPFYGNTEIIARNYKIKKQQMQLKKQKLKLKYKETCNE